MPEQQISEHLADRIFDKIECLRLELGEKIDGLATHFAEESAKCGICRPVVIGNGKKGIDLRVDRIEGIVGRIRWMLTAVVAPVAVYGVYALLQRWLKLP